MRELYKRTEALDELYSSDLTVLGVTVTGHYERCVQRQRQCWTAHYRTDFQQGACGDYRVVPQARTFKCNLSGVEGKIRRPRGIRREAAAGAR